MKVRSSWIVMSVLALVAVGLAFGAVSIRTDGDIVTDGQFVSLETISPPLQVSSSVLVTGLNAEFLRGLDWTSFAGAVHFHDDLYFTETELSTSFGGGMVHWDNVTSVPADLADGDDVFTPAEGPCFDDANRYVDCLNGTVTDTVTGLIWLQDASCLGFATYAGANQRAAQLGADADKATCGLTDNSNPGDWRLPTRAEWDATISLAEAPVPGLNCAFPTLTDKAGTACFANDPAFSGVHHDYWSSSAFESLPGRAWRVNLEFGFTINVFFKGKESFVWPVRGGQ